MSKDIWLNLPVRNIAKSKEFFIKLGFKHNEGPGNSPVSASFLIGDRNFVLMLFQDNVFETINKQNVCSPALGSEMLISLSAETKEEVQAMEDRARAAGGDIFAKTGGENGMYGCGFADLDGHRWNVLYMGMQ